ncbi:STAS domain-containing protein [Actinomadura rudentiformis]|uniref:STAS domain-containing protein n=1 Tax=Actinomadura rudentiformis TaxID=359158 RepID=UPI00178C3F8A|nr:STAS domain-containing protein [Actinomadura rudentiformis]
MDVGHRHGWTVLGLRGELDIATTPFLHRHVNDTMRTAAQQAIPPQVALDLTDLLLCDSSGLNLLIRAWKQITTIGGRLLLLNPRQHLRETLARTGLDRYLTIIAALPA